MAPNFPQTMVSDGEYRLQHCMLEVDRGISYSQAMGMLKEKQDRDGPLRFEGFWRSKKPFNIKEWKAADVRHYYLLIQKPLSHYAYNARPMFKTYRPGKGLGEDMSVDEIREMA